MNVMEEKMTVRVPAPISAEHNEMNAELERALKAGGLTGAAAKEVARLLKDHIARDEEFALPPLALLKQLSRGEVDSSMTAVCSLIDRFESELPNMLAEHFAIVQALNRLSDAADSDGLPDQMRFAEKLIARLKMEEDILYPAALLVGRYLKATHVS